MAVALLGLLLAVGALLRWLWRLGVRALGAGPPATSGGNAP
jgi:hypothetical protein